jgi:hypothetical protein
MLTSTMVPAASIIIMAVGADSTVAAKTRF